MGKPIQTKPEPYCPECGARMKLRRPIPAQSWDTFWGCVDYPECKGSRDILDNGKPEMDDEAWDGWRDG